MNENVKLGAGEGQIGGEKSVKLIPIVESLEKMDELRKNWQEWRIGYEKEIESRTVPEHERVKEEMSKWIYSESGQQTMEIITKKINEAVFRGEFVNTPASHDLRHYLSDLAESIKVIREDIPKISKEGWLIATVVPSMWHDMGKGAEAKLNREHVSGIKGTDHAIIATDALANFLDTNGGGDMPTEIKKQMLYAILVHQEGKAIMGTEMAAIVATADRAQLVGPEGVRRMVVHDAGLKNTKIIENPDRRLTVGLPLPSSEQDKDLNGHIMFYARNLFPQATDVAQERANKMKMWSAKFVWITASPESRAIYFAPEMRAYEGLAIEEDLKDYEVSLGGKTYNKPLSLEVWEEIKQVDRRTVIVEEKLYPNMTTEELLGAYIWRKNANPTDTDPVTGDTIDIEGRLVDQLKALSPEAQKRWKTAFAYSLYEMDKQDIHTKSELADIIDDESLPMFYRQMAAMLFSTMGSGKVEAHGREVIIL